MTPIQNSIAYIQGFEFGQDIAKKEMRLAVEAEREACAKVCDDKHDTWRWDDEADSASGPRDCAAAIRARGNT
jgi:surface antigen